MSDYTFTYENGEIDADCECEWLYDCGGRYRETEECDHCTRKRESGVKEKSMFRSFFLELDCAASIPARLRVIERMFEYVLTVGPFLDAHPRVRAAVAAKVAELRLDPRAAPLTHILDRVASFLAFLGEPVAP